MPNHKPEVREGRAGDGGEKRREYGKDERWDENSGLERVHAPRPTTHNNPREARVQQEPAERPT